MSISDIDQDGDVDADDHALLSAYRDPLTTNTESPRVPTSRISKAGNPYAHQGLPYDAEIGRVQNRNRQYNPAQKRFMQKDPLVYRTRAGSRYQDGVNPYSYVSGCPTRWRDPSGLIKCFNPDIFLDLADEAKRVRDNALKMVKKAYDKCDAGANRTLSFCKAKCAKLRLPSLISACEISLCYPVYGVQMGICRAARTAGYAGADIAYGISMIAEKEAATYESGTSVPVDEMSTIAGTGTSVVDEIGIHASLDF